MTITEFLTARLDEWEQEAHRKWAMRDGTDLHVFSPLVGAEGYYMVETSSGQRVMSYDEFNAEYMDPAPDTDRLAQVAAMRAIVELCVAEYNDTGWPLSEDVLRHLAAIWSDHDNYDPAWGLDAPLESPRVCGKPAPISYAGVTGECTRSSGHPVFAGSTGLTSTEDVEMHETRTNGVVIRWTDPDDQDRHEVRCSANVARDQFYGQFG